MATKLEELKRMMSPTGDATKMFSQPTFSIPAVPAVGEQQAAPQKESESIYDQLSKAFKSFGAAMKTPGFQQVLGQMGQALAPSPESWQARLGTVGASIGKGRQYDQYVSKLLAGQPTEPGDAFGLSPEEQLQARQTVETLKLKQAEQATAEKAQAASQFYTGALGTAALQAQQTAAAQIPIQQQEADARTLEAKKGQFRMESVPSGTTPGQEQTYLYDAASGQYKPVTSGVKQIGGGGELSAAGRMTEMNRQYKLRRDNIVAKYGSKGIQIVMGPDGNVIPIFPDADMEAQFLADVDRMVQEGIASGDFSEAYGRAVLASNRLSAQVAKETVGSPQNTKKQWP